MLGRSVRKTWFVIALPIATITSAQTLLADNTLSLKKSSDKAISIELTNADAVEGMQFSINGRGGVTLLSFERSDRSVASGLEVYQYSKDNSTMNIVILAPVRSSLASGAGSLGTITFSLDKSSASDSARVFLTNIVMCNAAAQNLTVSANELVWNTEASSAMQQVGFALEPNFPNPFNPSTTIAYRLEKPSNVRLTVYDIAGREIKILVNEFQADGRYSVRWEAAGRGGALPASGMYFACLQVGDRVAVQKMILAK